MSRWLVLVLSAILLVACAGVPSIGQASCQTEAAAFIEQVQPLAQEWDDANELANNTSRGSMAPQVAALQAIRRKAQALDVPECAQAVRDHLVESMDATIDGYLAFLGQESDAAVSVFFKAASRAQTEYENELLRIQGLEALIPATATVPPTRTPLPTTTPRPTLDLVSIELVATGSIPQARVAYLGRNSDSVSAMVSLPWSMPMSVPRGRRVTLTTQKYSTEGAVTCAIKTADGTELDYDQTDGNELLASCAAVIP